MRGNSRKKVGYLAFENFMKLPLTKFKEIAFHGWGEPLLHPNLFKMIKYAKSLGLKTSLITNGVILERKLEEIFSSGLDELAFGVYTLQGNAKVLENISRLVEEKRERRSNLKIYIDITIFSENITEIPEIVKIGNDVGVNAIILHRIFNLHDKSIEYISKEEEKKLFGKIKKIKGIKVYFPPKKHEVPCRVIKKCVYVTWDCKQSPCCFLCEMGYVFETPPEKIIDRHMEFIREMRKNEICKNCFW